MAPQSLPSADAGSATGGWGWRRRGWWRQGGGLSNSSGSTPITAVTSHEVGEAPHVLERQEWRHGSGREKGARRGVDGEDEDDPEMGGSRGERAGSRKGDTSFAAMALASAAALAVRLLWRQAWLCERASEQKAAANQSAHHGGEHGGRARRAGGHGKPMRLARALAPPLACPSLRCPLPPPPRPMRIPPTPLPARRRPAQASPLPRADCPSSPHPLAHTRSREPRGVPPPPPDRQRRPPAAAATCFSPAIPPARVSSLPLSLLPPRSPPLPSPTAACAAGALVCLTWSSWTTSGLLF